MVTRPAPPSTTRHHPVNPGPPPLRERPSIYMAMLNEQLEARAREHGHAYVTPREAAWLEVNDLRQPGHTIHRFSTMEEDRSDASLERISNVSSRDRATPLRH